MIKINRRNPPHKLLILDIDETLAFIDNKYMFAPHEKPIPEFKIFDYFGIKRPYLDQFLRDASKKYDLAIWTSGTKDYAEKVVETIIPSKIKLKFIFSRNELTANDQKDLDTVLDWFPEYSKKDIIVLDDSKDYYLNDKNNLILIKKFHGNPNDEELIRVFKLL